MRVIVTGGSGLIGVPLVSELAKAGHEVIVLSRSPAGKAELFPSGVRVTTWDARSGEGWAHLINADTAVVNLAGEGVANWRWTDGPQAAGLAVGNIPFLLDKLMHIIVIITFISTQMLLVVLWTFHDNRDNQLICRPLIMFVSTGDMNGQCHAPFVYQQMQFRAFLAAIRRVFACSLPPSGAGTILLSIDCHFHLILRRLLGVFQYFGRKGKCLTQRTQRYERRKVFLAFSLCIFATLR